MYGCLYNDSIVAFHDDFDVVDEYTEFINDLYGLNARVIKIRKQFKTKIRINYSEFELIKFNFIYIRAIDRDYFDIIDISGWMKSIELCRSILLNILQNQKDLKQKDKKTVESTLKILTKLSINVCQPPNPATTNSDPLYEYLNLINENNFRL